jgi:hypothetical protein
MENVTLKSVEETTLAEMPVEDIVALVNHAISTNRLHQVDLLIRLEVIAEGVRQVADSLKRIADGYTGPKQAA